MTLFSETRVELSTKVLDFFSEDDSLENRCTKLQRSLAELCPSISFTVTVTNGGTETETASKLEICGQWEDIVKVKEALNVWSLYKDTHPETSLTLEKFLSDPSVVVVTDHQHEQQKTSPKGRKQKQVHLHDEATSSVAHAPHRKASGLTPNAAKSGQVPLLDAAEIKKEKDDEQQFYASSRPRRSIQNTVLPLLKRKERSQRTIASHSDSEMKSNSRSPGRNKHAQNSAGKGTKLIVKVEKSPVNSKHHEQSVNPPLKRGRGRPRKKLSPPSHEGSEYESGEDMKETARSPLKVRLGRPRKKPCNTPDEMPENEAEEDIKEAAHSPLKVRRGRPRKLPSNTPDEMPENEFGQHIKEAAHSPLKVRRGRPRKLPSNTPDEMPENESEEDMKEAAHSPLKVQRGHPDKNTSTTPDIIDSEVVANCTEVENVAEDAAGVNSEKTGEDSATENCHGSPKKQIIVGIVDSTTTADHSEDDTTNIQQADGREVREQMKEQGTDSDIQASTSKKVRRIRRPASYGNAIKNMIVHKDGEFRCTKCSRTAPKLISLQYHVMRAHMSRDFKCDQCDKSYSLYKDLSAHKLSHRRPFPCKLCPKKFAQAYMLKNHERKRHVGIPKKRGPKPKPPKSDVDAEKDKNTYQCEKCVFTTGLHRYLIAHVQRVHGEKIHECTECGKAYARKKDLTYHLKCHSDSSKCECPICHKVLVNKHGLKLHTNVVHLGMPPPPMKKYQCELCGKVSRNITDHKTHMNKTHLNIRPYQCPMCPVNFFSRSGLRAHSFIHGDTYGYECTVCGKKFKQRQGLRVHSFMHKAHEELPFKCTSCDRVFTQPGALIRHKRTHTGERPYVCKFCCATFSDYSVLRRHLMGTHKLKDTPDLVRSLIQEACKQAQKVMEMRASAEVESGQELTDGNPTENVLHSVHPHNVNRQAKRRRPRMESNTIPTTILIKQQEAGPWISAILPDAGIVHEQQLSLQNFEVMEDASADQGLNNLITQLEAGSEPARKKQRMHEAEAAEEATQLSSQPLTDVHNYSVQRKLHETAQVEPSGSLQTQAVEVLTMEPQYTESCGMEPVIEPAVESKPEPDLERQESKPLVTGVPEVIRVQPQQAQNIQASEDGTHMTLVTQYGDFVNVDPEVQHVVEEVPEDVKPQLQYKEEMETITLPEGLLQQLQSQHLTMLQDGRPVVLQTVGQGQDTEHIIVITQMADDQEPDIGTLLSVQPDGEIQASYEDVGSAVEVAYQEAVVASDPSQLDDGQQGEMAVTYTQAPTVLQMLQGEHQ